MSKWFCEIVQDFDGTYYAKQVASILERNGVRVEVDNRNETIGKKIREAHRLLLSFYLIYSRNL